MAQRFVMEMKEKSVYKRYPIIASVVDKLAVIVDKVFAIQERLYDDMRTSKNRDRFFLKEANEFINYQGAEYQIKRPAWNDRVFPLETVRLQSYGQTHDADLTGAIIHTGMSADEYARSFNALAITIGRNIFYNKEYSKKRIGRGS